MVNGSISGTAKQAVDSDQRGWVDGRPGGCGGGDGSVSVSCGEGCLRKWRGCDFIEHAGSRVKKD